MNLTTSQMRWALVLNCAYLSYEFVYAQDILVLLIYVLIYPVLALMWIGYQEKQATQDFLSQTQVPKGRWEQ